MSQQELADWAGTSADAVGRFLRSWRDRGIIARGERSRRLTVVDLDGLAAICDVGRRKRPAGAATGPPERPDARRRPGGAGKRSEAPLAVQDWHEPLNCSVVFTDVAGFRRIRCATTLTATSCARRCTRSCGHRFEASGVPWAGCYHEDRGDGAVIVVPPTISTLRVVDPLIPELAARLRQYNRRASEVVRIQLRVALHVGPVGKDAEGLTGQAVIADRAHPGRPRRSRPGWPRSTADLIFAVSDYVYDHVVRNCDGQVDSGAFEHVECQVKESHVSAWAHLAGRMAPPRDLGIAHLARAGHPARARCRSRPRSGKLPAEVRGREGLIGELRRALRPYPRRASRAFVIAGMGGLGKSTVALAAARMARERGYRVWWVGRDRLGAADQRDARGAAGARRTGIGDRPGARGRADRARAGVGVPERRPRGGPALAAGVRRRRQPRGAGRRGRDDAGRRHRLAAGRPGRDGDRDDPEPGPAGLGDRVTLRELKPLDDEAGAEVLRDLAPEVADPGGHEARELSRRLGGLPLALHLAGAYLGSPFARWSTFAGYRQALDSVELPAALADIEGPGADIRATVQRTWDLSLDALAAEGRPQARPLLLVLSCFAPATPIPAWLLQLPPLADLLAGTRQAGAARPETIRPRRTAARLRRGPAGPVAHRADRDLDQRRPGGRERRHRAPVVADANRSRLAAIAAAERAAVQETAVALLEAAAAGLDPARPGTGRPGGCCVPHMNAAIDLLADDLAAAVLARLLTVSAVGTEALLGGGRLAAAGKLAQASVAAAAFLSRDDPAAHDRPRLPGRTRWSGAAAAARPRRSTVSCSPTGSGSRARITSTPWRPGTTWPPRSACRAATARPSSCTAGCSTTTTGCCGPDHRETLAARYNLARMIGLQGRYAEAEELGRQVLADQRRVLGDRSTRTRLATRQNLARLTGKAGRYAEAERMYRRVLADRRRVLGDDHPDTLATRHRLARMIGLQGRYGEAEELCHQILDDRRRLLGEDHPDNLATRHRLARMLGLQGRYADAEPMFRQVLAARRRAPGRGSPRHPRHRAPARLAHRPAGPLQRGHRDREPGARRPQERPRRRSSRHPGRPRDPGLADRAARQARRGRGAGPRGAGRPPPGPRRGPSRYPHHPRHPGLADRAAGPLRRSRAQYRDVLADRQRVLGPDHPDTLIARHALARMLGLQRRYAEAEQLCREVLADRRRVLGDDHPDTLTSRDTLAWLAARQGRRAEAEELYRQVLADRSRVLGADHPDTQATRDELAGSPPSLAGRCERQLIRPVAVAR